MDVRSAYNLGLTGFQDASTQLSNASSRVAGAGSAETTITGDPGFLENQSSTSERTPASLTAELVNLKVAEFQAKSSAKVISTADEVVGTLINTTV